MRGFLLSIFFLTCTFSYLFAQQAMPVKWVFAAEKVDNQNYEIILTASVERGWYVYSQHLEEGGPIPTSINFEEGQSIETLGKANELGKKKEGFDEMFEMNVIKYSDKVKFMQKIKVKKGTKTIKGYVEFMTCDDTRCLPPAEVPFSIDLK